MNEPWATRKQFTSALLLGFFLGILTVLDINQYWRK